MKKKLLSLLLALSLMCSLAVPAFAQAEAADERLAAVTLRVKETLDLDTERYTQFYGNLDEHILAPSWYLDWYGDGASLTISASEEGKILSYYRYEQTVSMPNSGAFAPTFPAGDRESAREAAEAFLRKVLTEGESFTIEDSGDDYLNMTTYRFRGEVLLNGLSAGLSYSIAVRCEDYAVMNFYRDDLNGRVTGGIPAATAKITEKEARAALRETLALRLEYVLSETDDGKAILRYLPEYGDEYYVDAATGKLVNLSELRRSLQSGATGGVTNDTAMKGETAEESVKAPSLSEAEKEGVSKLEGVLSKEDLDARARAVAELGLEPYTLSGVSYSVLREDAEDQTVTATVQYGRQVNGAAWRRTVVLNAKTGELLRVSSSAWMNEKEGKRPVDQKEARGIAEAFLQKYAGAQFKKTDLYDDSDALGSDWQVSHSFTFAQKENGYFYNGNTLYVGVDATDGSVSSYTKNFDDTLTFESPAGIISEDNALDAWLETYDAPLSYIQVPVAIDYSHPDYQALKDYGITYLNKLVPGYALKREDTVLGINAADGKPAKPLWADTENGLTYSDMDGHWAQEKVEKLAKYGVGYRGGTFEADAALTQLDLIALLVSTTGYVYDAAAEKAADNLYEYAYDLGLLKREQRQDAAVLTRAETVKLILDAVGYGPVAQLKGIYRTRFRDDASIPADCYGYVALAQGLGMVEGMTDGSFRPNANTTRAHAAVMLYNLMEG